MQVRRRNPRPPRVHRPDPEAGQALLLALAVLLVTSLLLAVMMTLWVRSAVRAQRYGDAAAALYAAEAGVSRALAALLRGEVTPPARDPVTLSGTVNPAAGPASYQVQIGPGGPGRWEVVSTGFQGGTTHVMRVTVTAPLVAAPVYAGRDLTLHVTPSHGSMTFSAPPGYGSQWRPPRGPGDIAPAPVPVSRPLPDVAFGSFAGLAGTPPVRGRSLAGSGGVLQAGWYEGGDCPGGSLSVPPKVTAGVRGDLACDRLAVGPGAALVVTGHLRGPKKAATVLSLEEGARLVVGGNADLERIRLQATSTGPQAALLVVGGELDVQEDVAAGGNGVGPIPPLAVLALDRSDCTFAACGPDDTNAIRIGQLKVPEFLLYAERMPGSGAQQSGSRINLELAAAGDDGDRDRGGVAGHRGGEGQGGPGDGDRPRLTPVTVRGAVVAAGDVEIRASGLKVTWSTGLELLAPYLGVVPAQVFYTVEAWQG